MSARRLPDLGLKPLSARSVVLSALLGSHPPRLPVRAVVALGAQFGIAEGTVRTALSRMVDTGELEATGSTYRLGVRLRRRQASQDVALHAPDEPWDGSWWVSIVDIQRRTLAARRAYRATMVEHRMGELRPDTWLRPANIPVPANVDGALIVNGRVTDRPAGDIAGQLWDLPGIAVEGSRLLRIADQACGWLQRGNADVLADSFLVSIAVVRFLRTEPQLPRAIVGAAWPPDRLRSVYSHLERAYAAALASFLADATDPSLPLGRTSPTQHAVPSDARSNAQRQGVSREGTP